MRSKKTGRILKNASLSAKPLLCFVASYYTPYVIFMTVTSTSYSPIVAVNLTATINGSTTSEEIDLSGTTLVGIYWPASLVGTSLKIQASATSGGTFSTIVDQDNVDYSITVDSSAGYAYIDPIVTAGARFVKLVSSASETSKTLTLAVRPI